MKKTDFIRKDDSESIRLDIYHEVPLLHFPKLDDLDMVCHCFTTKEGGVSKGIFSSLNLSFTRGDEEQAVLENYERLAKAMGTVKENFVATHQTHTTNVMRVGKEQCGCGVVKERGYEDIDGLITNEPEVVLSTYFADCVPLFFVDPVNRAIGMSHSGWRGTVGRMGKVTLEAMTKEFGTKPEDVIAAIGPSICKDCYEISEDVAEEFYKEFGRYGSQILEAKGNGKYQLDLWETNRIVLCEAGVKAENIAITNICTCCNPNLLFSHRATNGKRGNLGAFMYIRC